MNPRIYFNKENIVCDFIVASAYKSALCFQIEHLRGRPLKINMTIFGFFMSGVWNSARVLLGVPRLVFKVSG